MKKGESLWNDIVYTDVMQSEGFVVDYAVCTTYSLDMPTLLSVPFMLGSMTEVSESSMPPPHIILESINRSADKFVVFCNAGCIAVPQSNSNVYALLEKSIVQVALGDKGKGFVNFHPKLWVIKESNPQTGERQIKLVVLSRNLTCSNDLDVVCELTAKVGKEKVSAEKFLKHKPLVDFLKWLQCKREKAIKDKIDAICKDIECIEKFDLNDTFVDYSFYPMGINGYNGVDQCLEGSILEGALQMLVISPFVDEWCLGKLCSISVASKTLITRYSSLTAPLMAKYNNESGFKDGIYVPKDVLTDEEGKDIAVDLHEKVYFVQKRNGCHLYLGSTNATKNGFGRNVEFLLHLQFAKGRISYDSYRGALINDTSESLFESVTAPPDTVADTKAADSEQVLRMVIAAIESASFCQDGDGYNVAIKCKELVLADTVSIYPLGDESKRVSLSCNVEFKGIALDRLSQFYVIEVGDIKRVIKVETTNMPKDRDDAIFRSVIKENEFFSYISFMLAENGEQYLHENQLQGKGLAQWETSGSEPVIYSSLYEDMVQMAYNNPARIDDIRTVIDRLGADSDVVPVEFKNMYDKFLEAVEKIKKLKKK